MKQIGIARYLAQTPFDGLSPKTRELLEAHLAKRDADKIFARLVDATKRGSEGRRIVVRAWSHIVRGA